MQKVLRSMLLENFPFDLRVQIELLSRKRGIENKAKQEELFKLLRDANIDNITPLGSGTNRYAFKMNGFVVKVATDHDGKIDNLKEMKMAKRLFPDVTKVYEVSQNGTLLVAEYIQPFQSFGEMQRYADQIRDILKKISQVYLIGDVGLDSKNYANWGLRVGSDSPVCLDFAYIYDAKSDLFICSECNTGSMLVPNSDYTHLVCPNPLCGRKYNFEDIRGRMSNETHQQEIGDLSEEAYLLSESNVLTELTPDRSNYLKKKLVVKESKQEEEEIMEFDNFIFNKEEEKMAFNTTIGIGAKAILAKGTFIRPKKNEENDVAFSGEIVDDTTIIQAKCISITPKKVTSESEIVETESVNNIPVEKEKPVEPVPTIITIPKEVIKPENTESIPEPAVITPKAAEGMIKAQVVIHDTPVEEKEVTPSISEDFKDNLNRCLTKIANKIKDMIYGQELWDEIRNNYLPAKIKPKPNGVFYDAVQSAIFHSLTKFLKMKPIERENGKKQWVCSDFNDETYKPTLIFLERWYSKKFINDAAPELSMTKYAEKYNDYLGIQREWVPDFRKALKEKLKEVEPAGIQYIIENICDVWCAPKQVDQPKPEPAPDPTPEPEVVTTEEPLTEDDMLAFSASVVSRIHDENKGDVNPELFRVDDPEEEDEEDDEELNDTEVVIYPDEKVDIIRLKFSDTFGNVEIPFYKKLSDINPNDLIPSLADDRNGDWDWLIHTIPDLRFLTSNPNQWLDLNNDDEFDDTVKFLILDPDHNGQVLMAMYAINGIFTVDENGVSQIENNPTILKQLNILFKSELGNSSMSHYARNISEADDIIRDEAYAKMILNGYLPDDEDQIEEDSDEPETTVVTSDDGDDSEELGILEPVTRRFK